MLLAEMGYILRSLNSMSINQPSHLFWYKMSSVFRSSILCSSMMANKRFSYSMDGGSDSTVWAGKTNLYPEYISIAVKTNRYLFHAERILT